MTNNDPLYLSGAQARELRARGHQLKPTVMVGREGLGPAVTAALEAVLCAHELVKIKIQEGCLEDKTTVAQQLAAASHSRIVQIIGRTILLYREIAPAADRKQEKSRCPAARSGRCAARQRSGFRSRSKTTAGRKVGKIRSLASRRR